MVEAEGSAAACYVTLSGGGRVLTQTVEHSAWRFHAWLRQRTRLHVATFPNDCIDYSIKISLKKSLTDHNHHELKLRPGHSVLSVDAIASIYKSELITLQHFSDSLCIF